MKKAASILLAGAILVSGGAVVTASESLVSKSYVDGTFTTQALEQVSKRAEEEMSASYNQALNELNSKHSSYLSQVGGGTGGTSVSSGLSDRRLKKGDVLTVAQVAGVMGAKRTPELIPMCHPILIDGIDLKLSLDRQRLSVEIEATVSCDGRTGVEMEALTAVSAAALTVYDMCKAVQKDMVIADIRLIRKSGGVHGDFEREEGR